ncbi:MAG: ATP-binding cassette domain-containing protein [Candidatus Thermoplasmatota archaeon]|jgi:ABC-type Mn2+/Zn2+ transport system ATPase subunit|nr:ATP-binding cassette domain-containing protein [Candidatus Thermoplasmatota archaeon]MCL5790560.1 ATP-binding cassette domain-containing protein [Candidatus Thermoplasmatota archaeon]
MIEVNHLSCGYFHSGNIPAIRNLDFSLNGRKAVIVGPNGSGKTSLLKACLGLMEIYEGDVRINGIDVRKIRNMKGVSTNLIDVYKLLNLDIGELAGLYSAITGSRRSKFIESLNEFSVDDTLHKKIYSLSTGQAKLVCDAMAFSSSPETILLDEPFESIDQGRKKILLNKIDSFRGEILMNTHEFNIVRSLKGWDLYFLIDGFIYGRFNTADINNLYFTEGVHEDALSVIRMRYGTFSITSGRGDLRMSEVHSFDSLIEVAE